MALFRAGLDGAARCGKGREEYLLITSWISAIGSAGALLGFAAYVWVMLLNRRDADDIRQENQAEGVAAWLEEGQRWDRDEDYVICVHNNGTAPIYNCSVMCNVTRQDHSFYLAIVPPNTTAIRPLPFDYTDFDADQLYDAAAVPTIEFTDSREQRWERDRQGHLHREDGERRVRRRLRPRPRTAERGRRLDAA